MSTIKGNKARGARTEIIVRDWLIERFAWPVERVRLDGVQDRGDLTGVPGLMIEVKSTKDVRWKLSKWVTEARRQGRIVGADWVIVVRPRLQPHFRQYWVLYDNPDFLPVKFDLLPSFSEACTNPAHVIEAKEGLGYPSPGLVSVTTGGTKLGVYCERAPLFFTRYYSMMERSQPEAS